MYFLFFCGMLTLACLGGANMRILLAEDERDLCRIIERKLKDEGYSVDAVNDGAAAMDCLAVADYDGIVLDIMMPKADGFEVLQSLRRRGKTTPVLFLTARDSIADRVRGLDSGANDYLVKPFSFEELMARVRAMTRNSFGLTDNRLTLDNLTLDLGTKKVTRGDRVIDLSAREYAILEYLMRNKGIVLSREKLENHIWNFDYQGASNLVDVYISYLRKKVDLPGEKKLIHTIRGRGYVLREEA